MTNLKWKPQSTLCKILSENSVALQEGRISEPEDKYTGVKMFTQQRYNNDKVWTEHTRYTGHYKTKYMNHGHKKREKVQDKKYIQ